MTLREYLTASREPRYSVTLVVPLLLLYEGLAALLSHTAYAGVRNGADVLLKTIFLALGGRAGVVLFGLMLLGVGSWLVMRDVHAKGRIRTRVFSFMLAESLVYAALLGVVVSYLTAFLLSPGLLTYQGDVIRLGIGAQLVVSLGAGLYEELLFRVLLVSGLTGLCAAMGMKRWVSVGIAIVASALIFSGFHYVGPLGDALTVPSFAFRAVAGLLLSGLYVARGFGITAWAHALYDVGLSIVRVA